MTMNVKLFVVFAIALIDYSCARLIHKSTNTEISYFGNIGEYIVGGSDAPIGSAPYQVSLRFIINDAHFCGGSIINNLWVLTAGHCSDGVDANTIQAVVGTNSLRNGGTRYKVSEALVHENYDPTVITNDVALLRLYEAIQFNQLVQPIPLPERNTPGGADLILTGWGRLAYPGLQSDALQIIALKSLEVLDCQKKLKRVNTVFVSQICSLTEEGEGACHGDSGGPLVENGTLVGVVSWGMPCARGLPDVYSRVFYFRDWIDTHAQNGNGRDTKI